MRVSWAGSKIDEGLPTYGSAKMIELFDIINRLSPDLEEPLAKMYSKKDQKGMVKFLKAEIKNHTDDVQDDLKAILSRIT